MFVIRSRSSVRGISPRDEWRLRWDHGSYACESPVVHGMRAHVRMAKPKSGERVAKQTDFDLGIYHASTTSWSLSVPQP